ncbi:MAG: hypothetical protein ACKVRP_10795 [Bacteroidota bacterium]
MSVHIFRPSMLLGERDEVRWEDVFIPPLMKMLSVMMIGPWKKFRAIEGKLVAMAMINVAKAHSPGIHFYESDQIQPIVSQASSN